MLCSYFTSSVKMSKENNAASLNCADDDNAEASQACKFPKQHHHLSPVAANHHILSTTPRSRIRNPYAKLSPSTFASSSHFVTAPIINPYKKQNIKDPYASFD